MTLVQILKLVLIGSIFLNVFALALRARAADVFFLFRNPALGVRAFLAMFVAVPVVAIAISLAFDLHPAVKIALVALALSPVPPLLPKRQLKGGASGSYIVGLLAGAALVSLVVVPLGLRVVGMIFGVRVGLSPLEFAPLLLITIAGPLAAGLLARRMLGDERAERVATLVARISGIVLLLAVLPLLYKFAPDMWALVGNGTMVALLAMIVAGLLSGYLFAGGGSAEKSGLALAASARHPGIAITIASVNFPEQTLAPAAILLAAVIGALVGIPLLRRLETLEIRGGRH